MVGRYDLHLAFCTLATRFRFASEPRSLFTPPFRKLEIFTIRIVGTISWFLDPISTCTQRKNESTAH